MIISKKLIVVIICAIGISLAYYFDWSAKKTPDLREKVSTCLALEINQQLSCVNKEVQQISKEHGVRVALDIIEPFSQQHSYLLDWSHEFSHTIGGAAIMNEETQDQSLENRIGKALVECDGYGAFGCYHGVIEAGLSILAPTERATVIRRACLENPLIQEKQYYVNQCLHWFGHGVAIFANLTLEQALAMCESLNSFNTDEVQLCLSGLFHAGSVPGDSDDELLHNVQNVYDKDDPYFPCLTVEERFKGHCFSHAAGRVMTSDPQVVFGVCDNIPEKDKVKKVDYVWRCYESGSNVLLPNILRDRTLTDEQKAATVVSECDKFSWPEYRKFCYSGAARYWVLRDPLLSNKNPFNICKGVGTDAKAMCYTNIGFGNNENYYSSEMLAEYCKNSEPEYVEACLARNPRLYLQ
jgi:hypothetical protein